MGKIWQAELAMTPCVFCVVCCALCVGVGVCVAVGVGVSR